MRVAFASCEPLVEDVSAVLPIGVGALSWVICGGESGHVARPMRPAWARRLRDACVEAGTSYWFKQWGEYLPRGQVPEFEPVEYHAGLDVREERGAADFARVGKKAAGALLDGRAWREGTR